MESCNIYESGCMREIMGETLRPGGFKLTDAGVQYCNLSPQDNVLDLGCGRGATVNYLKEKYGITAYGIDPSEKMIRAAREKYSDAGFYLESGEHLPFEDGSFDCVFAECTLSLMDVEGVLAQVYRVLKENGWFVITDVYAKNPEAASGLEKYPIHSCFRGMHDLDRLRNKFEQEGFSICCLEDYSHCLKELVVKIGFSYGSMRDFWNAASEQCICSDEFYDTIKQCKPGYFLMIARKKGYMYG